VNHKVKFEMIEGLNKHGFPTLKKCDQSFSDWN